MRRPVRLLLLSLAILSNGVAAQSVTINVDVFGLNENQFNTNTALQDACVAIDTGGATSAEALDLLATCAILDPLDREDPALASALNSLVPEEAFTLSDSLTEAPDVQVSNVLSRIATVRRTTAPTVSGFRQSTAGWLPGNLLNADADGTTKTDVSSVLRSNRLEFFVAGQGSNGEVEGAGIQQSGDVESSNLTLGIDYRITSGMVVGLGTGFSSDTTSFSDVNGGTTRDGIDLTAFGTYYDESSVYVDLVLDIGRSGVDLERQLSLDGSPVVLGRGSTDSTTVSLTLAVGADIPVGGWNLGPRARLGFSRSSVDAYRESASSSSAGFGSALDIDAQTISSGKLTMGAYASRAISTARAVVVPHLNVELEYETEQDKNEIGARFLADPAGNVFAVRGTQRDRQYMNIDVGANAVFARGRSAFVSYGTRLQHDFITRHWLRVGARLEF